MTEKYEIDWWRKWLEGDILTRAEMVNKAPFLDMLLNLPSAIAVSKEDMARLAASQLNGIFEDLVSAVYTNIAIENENKKRKE